MIKQPWVRAVLGGRIDVSVRFTTLAAIFNFVFSGLCYAEEPLNMNLVLTKHTFKAQYEGNYFLAFGETEHNVTGGWMSEINNPEVKVIIATRGKNICRFLDNYDGFSAPDSLVHVGLPIGQDEMYLVDIDADLSHSVSSHRPYSTRVWKAVLTLGVRRFGYFETITCFRVVKQ